MEDFDMSKPGAELFPESTPMQYNSYMDSNVGDPLDTGVNQPLDVAGPAQTNKEHNFAALREEVAKFKQESEYWRGKADALSSQYAQPAKAQSQPEPKDPFSDIDWEDSSGIKQAIDYMRQENQRLKNEILDSMAAVQSKAQHSDWNNMVTQHVPQLTSKNPIFAEMIERTSNPYEAAYLLAELNARASAQAQPMQQPMPQHNGNAQRVMQNAQKPQSLAAVGGNGSLSAADYYATMSDEDFMKIAARNLANI